MKLDWITIVVYIIVIILIWYVVHAEIKDVNCQDTEGTICGPLTGRAYSYGKPEPGDSKEVLLDKVRITARYDMNSIYWRRSFLAAITSAILVLYVLNNRLPNAFELIVAFLITYIIIYITLTLFQRWVAEPALKQMDHIIEALEHTH